MRILHLVWAPRLSGAEVLAKDLAIHQRNHGDTVGLTSLLPQQDDFAQLRAELETHEIACVFPERMPSNVGKLWHLYKVIRQFKPDVLIAHATIPAFYARALPTRVPVIYVMHSAVNDFERSLFRCVERLLSRRARAVIGVSETSVKEYVATIGRHPLMQVIPNGVDTTRFVCTTSAENWSRAPQIVQIGRYNAIKNQLQTVRAFAEVTKRIADVRLLLIGVIEDSAYFAQVQDLVRELGLEDRAIVDGPRSDISRLLSDSSVFAMPSLSEGHSIAFLEALATGIPVVASTIEAFAFARDFPGVQLVDTADTSAYAQAFLNALRQPRVERALKGLTLNDTAEQYLAIARRVACAGA
ncbi:glycosyltransferase family 4 protein [Paraburkholderia sp. BL10I2N1]|uniref:glycosyltransferase family 4 protein n=1 Tax=Paraburkholderia sp. BL10I2N1 TaxID=1938796 RepID=UPI00105D9ADC|nr:glycosyltransferase family 4 protein [Paraburkholderia sp. BL10I2N1]TDN67440.1 glycosyltransferase involved in cell wall biosynthesis [Paraburkholderia sp. BL10I2N1]